MTSECTRCPPPFLPSWNNERPRVVRCAHFDEGFLILYRHFDLPELFVMVSDIGHGQTRALAGHEPDEAVALFLEWEQRLLERPRE